MNYKIDINDKLHLDKYIDLLNSKQSFILDTKKESLCSLETLVKEIALIHLTRLFTDFTEETISEIYTIEFHLSTNINGSESKQTYVDINNKTFNNFHSHLQHKQIITSSITFFDNIENEIITNQNDDASSSFTGSVNPEVFCLIDSEKYKYKYNDDKIVLFIFPEKGKHVYFDEEMYCNGTYNCCQDTGKNICLYIRIWKQCVPLNSIQFNEQNYITCISEKKNIINISNGDSMFINITNKNRLIEFPLLKISNNSIDKMQYFYNLILKINLHYEKLQNNSTISADSLTDVSNQPYPSSFWFYNNDKNYENNDNILLKKEKNKQTTKYDTFYNYHFLDDITMINSYIDFNEFGSLWIESQYIEIIPENFPNLFDRFFTIFNVIINEIFVNNLLSNQCPNITLQNMYIVKNNIDFFYILLKKKNNTIVCCILLTKTERFDDFKICFTDKTFTYLQSGHLLICCIDLIESINVPIYDFNLFFFVFVT